VAVVLRPYYLMATRLAGTIRGSPHPYDTQVPLLVYGPGVRPGPRADRVTPQATVPILARALGVKLPADPNVPVPARRFDTSDSAEICTRSRRDLDGIQ